MKRILVAEQQDIWVVFSSRIKKQGYWVRVLVRNHQQATKVCGC